ncbi:MAG: N-formylglutamate amidohydrolase [Candidatus Thorarchaeota archaeon]
MNLQKYFEIREGIVPIILSCPHGGFLSPKKIPDKLKGVQIADKNKFLISKRIIQVLYHKFDIQIYYILSKIHRSKVDFNRPPRAFSAFNHSSIEAKRIHHLYHESIQKFYQDCLSNFNRCLFIDLHGFTKPHKDYPDIIFGNLFGTTLKIINESKIRNVKKYWGFTEMVESLSKNFTLDDGLGMSDFNLSYSGGYIIHQFYKRNLSNAFQIEVSKHIRETRLLTEIFIGGFVSAIKNCLKDK